MGDRIIKPNLSYTLTEQDILTIDCSYHMYLSFSVKKILENHGIWANLSADLLKIGESYIFIHTIKPFYGGFYSSEVYLLDDLYKSTHKEDIVIAIDHRYTPSQFESNKIPDLKLVVIKYVLVRMNGVYLDTFDKIQFLKTLEK
jgi:hypothetical protein